METLKKLTFLILFLFGSTFLVYVIVQKQKSPQTTVDINGKIINVEIANTPSKITRGLMGRKELDENSGMLFIFETENYQPFWMKNTLTPLDIIFVNKNFEIVDIKKDFKPCVQKDCESYLSKEPALYVIEVNSGWCNKNHVQLGDKVVVR